MWGRLRPAPFFVRHTWRLALPKGGVCGTGQLIRPCGGSGWPGKRLYLLPPLHRKRPHQHGQDGLDEIGRQLGEALDAADAPDV